MAGRSRCLRFNADTCECCCCCVPLAPVSLYNRLTCIGIEFGAGGGQIELVAMGGNTARETIVEEWTACVGAECMTGTV